MKLFHYLTLLVSLGAAALAAPPPKVYSELLVEMEREAIALHQHSQAAANMLWQPSTSWQTQARHLAEARAALNRMGANYVELWNRQKEAAAAEREAIRQTLPRLMEAMECERAALRELSGQKNLTGATPFGAAVRGLDESAAAIRRNIASARELARLQAREREIKAALVARNAN